MPRENGRCASLEGGCVEDFLGLGAGHSFFNPLRMGGCGSKGERTDHAEPTTFQDLDSDPNTEPTTFQNLDSEDDGLPTGSQSNEGHIVPKSELPAAADPKLTYEYMCREFAESSRIDEKAL